MGLHVDTLQIEQRDNHYHLQAQFQVARSRAEVFALLRDYDRWQALSPTIRESERLLSFGAHRHHVRSVSSACVLIFCAKLMQVQLVTESPPDRITARTLPAQSNVRRGRVEWQLKRVQIDGVEQTELQLDLELEPMFWIPPLIGPWLVGYLLEQEVRTTAQQLERLPLSR